MAPLAIFLFSLLLWAAVSALAAAWFFAGTILFYLLLHMRQLAALTFWLADSEKHVIPDGLGMWEDIFARLNRMMRKHRQERKQHNVALQYMEQAAAAFPDGVAILDGSDRIEWCNPLAQQHFGLDGVRDIGQQITYLARQPEFIQYLAKQDFALPLVLHDARQDELTLSIKLIPYGANKRLLISRDITHIERIETMRRDFIANVSHELRTPLTVVNGFVETLCDMPSLKNDPAQRALHLMAEQTQRMEHLVNDLLTLSQLDDELNALREELVDIPAVLRTLYQEGQTLSGDRHDLQLELMTSCNLLGNREELRSAFGNLLSNAIRYTPQGGRIVMRWQDRIGQPTFSVRDNGIGIVKQHLPRLTERFYRVDQSRSRATGGTGLGLAIVKHVALRHQAKLEISSEVNHGSEFCIVFPANRRA